MIANRYTDMNYRTCWSRYSLKGEVCNSVYEQEFHGKTWSTSFIHNQAKGDAHYLFSLPIFGAVNIKSFIKIKN